MVAVISVLLAALLGLAVMGIAAVSYSVVFPRQPFTGPRPPVTASEHDLARRLEGHVRAVASVPHNVDHYPSLLAAAAYIEDTLESLGHTPASQVYEVYGKPVRNIEVVLGPPEPATVADAYVIGAHYDSPDDSPGANDNGTGVAALLELARLLRDVQHGTTRLRLVFFVNEEQPFGHTQDMGSWRHAERMAAIAEPIRGMVALETLGYFSDTPGSQRFPWPFGFIYPDTGNFVAFVGLPRSRAFLRRALGLFRRNAAFPSVGGVGPRQIPGFALSDHWSYDQFGFPAFMVTDTAPFRNPHYHEPGDLPDTVDYASLARITAALAGVITALATTAP